MKRKLIFTSAVILLLASACQNAPEPYNGAEAKTNEKHMVVQAAGAVDAGALINDSVTAAANRSAAQNASAAKDDWIPLSWEKISVSGNLQVLKEGLNQVERIVKITTLYAISGSRETKVVIYAKKGDADHLHAALVRDDVVYDLGPAAGYSYDQDDALTVNNIMLFQKEVVKIQGSVGAAASKTRYIDLTDGTPKLLLSVDEGIARYRTL